MKVINKVNTSWSQVVCWDYIFDNGYSLTMFNDGYHVARTSKGNSVKHKTLPLMTKLISQWEDTQIQIK
jgi:hypothetical protein